MKKNVFLIRFCTIVLLVGIHCSFLFAQSNSTVANKKTALRCLQLAKEYVSLRSYDAALSQIQLGLAYDNSLSDLWYLLTVCKQSQGANRAELIPFVVNSLQYANWNDYNYDNARLLYARLLCDTNQFEKAVAILDEKPMLMTADAELIRIKAYYCMHTSEATEKARNRIEADARIYLQDYRFARLFYAFEYEEQKLSGSSTDVLKQAQFFYRQLPKYKNLDASLESELAIYSASFLEGEEQIRAVKAFAAKGLRHPLYAILALRLGIVDQSAALDYFASFASEQIPLTILHEFAPLITDTEVKASFVAYLTAYEGKLLIDTDGDLDGNLQVTYKRGRPAWIVWDKNNDGNINLSAECDFGATQIVELGRGVISVTYDEYPYVVSILYRNTDKENDIIAFTMVPHEYTWEPYSMAADVTVQKALSMDFFVPTLKATLPDATLTDIIKYASKYEIPSKEYEGAQISFSVLNGIVQDATYTLNGVVYAKTYFANGLPEYRIVDRNNDGLFETRETFSYDPENLLNRSLEDQSLVMLDVFGTPSNSTGIYIDSISIDNDNDSFYEYQEQYLADGGKICSWYPERSSVWNVRYTKYPLGQNGDLVEDAQFFIDPHHQMVTVHSINGAPSMVTIEIDGELVEYSVTKGKVESFYWIGEIASEDDEQIVVSAIQAVDEQGVSVSVPLSNDAVAFAVRIGKTIYSKIMQVSQSEN
ncbi:MAG: hypothetical protein K6E51_11585 [Treponema sp.]|nr:hypothetical protein [Treponema sp.]